MTCSSCGAENASGRRFCRECGAALAAACPACGAANDPADKFCGQCGATLAAAAQTGAPVAQSMAHEEPSSERRLVSVLFADLVGFTTLSETRDAEEVRDLLTRYFDIARQIIGRYGGTIEKFIGDAVMAVWGTPTAHEDDAERAVRAALDLTQAVTALGGEVGAADLRARAGVLTGEAAVTIGAEGQGMVAGDMVNTASRIQSAAEPGNVLVGEITRRASEAAIDYEDAGTHELKGKAEPVRLWRATRVVAGRGGALRSTGLEPPFVGRDRELRLLKELFHGSADEGRTRLVSVVGAAGIGKSRLAWEFEKYTDGLAGSVWWNRGRCLAYGEGVTYWALAEMVRMRAGIAEGEEAGIAWTRLKETMDDYVKDPEERRWLEPRLAHLLGLEERSARDREDLFAAWRMFFERLSEKGPAIMVFEDMQWADASLLDFIEYLLDWSKNHPIFILTVGRPELTDRRPDWGAGKRGFTSLYLEPLGSGAMGELLTGIVPGLPEDLHARILERAEGVPLYAVETVRTLLDKGLVIAEGNEYRLSGPIEVLEVPQTLHALIAARLDGLTHEERRLLQDASVLGKAFTKPALSALTRLSPEELDPLLASLVKKELLSLQADPRSPERGQHGFLQELVRRVAYETLSKKERKARHLAAASLMESSGSGEEGEIVEVLAAHYVEAYLASPDATDAAEIKAKAREWLARAGQRAASLAASEDAQRYFERGADLADDPLIQADLLDRAGQMAWAGGRIEIARSLFERAMALFDANGQLHRAARVSGRLGDIIWAEGHIDQAVQQMEESFAVLSEDEPDEDLASFAAQLGRFLFFMGQSDRAIVRIELALQMAESLWLPEVLSQSLNTKALILVTSRGRPEEGLALLRHALSVALDNDAPRAALRAYFNLSNLLYYRDDLGASAENAREGLALARRLGERDWEWNSLADLVSVTFLQGEWDEALDLAAEIPHLEDFAATRFAAAELLLTLPQLHVARGDVEEAARTLEPFVEFENSADVQERASWEAARAAVFRAQGMFAEALASGQEAFAIRSSLGATHAAVKAGWVEAAEAAFALGDDASVKDLLQEVQELRTGQVTPYLRAQATRLGARRAVDRGEADAAEPGLKAAAGLFREIGMPFWLAVALLELGEWLLAQGRSEEAGPVLGEAQEIFERLKARPWLERLGQVAPVAAAERG